MTTGWIAMTFGTDIQGSQRMNPNDLCDPLTFSVALKESCYLLSESSQHLLMVALKEIVNNNSFL